jgi:hypothetical protein
LPPSTVSIMLLVCCSVPLWSCHGLHAGWLWPAEPVHCHRTIPEGACEAAATSSSSDSTASRCTD